MDELAAKARQIQDLKIVVSEHREVITEYKQHIEKQKQLKEAQWRNII